MFSGIVEASSEIVAIDAHDQSVQVVIKKPSNFNDLNKGDSLSVNGVCLTIEALLPEGIQLSLGPETLDVTGWNQVSLALRPLNLERSLKQGDRVHGHYVSGHVDLMGDVLELNKKGDSLIVRIGFSKAFAKYFWRKGSVAVNGVSLTLNEVNLNYFEVCLIPETLRQTNLRLLQVGEKVCLEVDSMARALMRNLELQNSELQSLDHLSTEANPI